MKKRRARAGVAASWASRRWPMAGHWPRPTAMLGSSLFQGRVHTSRDTGRIMTGRVEDTDHLAGRTTLSIHEGGELSRAQPIAGAVLIFAEGRAAARVFRIPSQGLELGRAELGMGGQPDPLISRRHARLVCDDSGGHVSDLDSRNGTFVNGLRVSGVVAAPPRSLVRIGGALLLLLADVVPFEHYGLGIRHSVVGGPELRRLLESVALVRSVKNLVCLLITGESGTGKEILAKAFHGADAHSKAPLSAVNCAAIPKELAERVLFGSRRGAFSGATDAPGLVQAAHGGTLFLDEVAELPLDVQSKLLRMLETRQVVRLGATAVEQVDLRICSATWRDLRAEVIAGRFREDLYFRMGQPEIKLPPLRDRTEEIPWHIQDVLSEFEQGPQRLEHGPQRSEQGLQDQPGPALQCTSSFVEACALRFWPGNIRELRSEVRRAALASVAKKSTILSHDELGSSAGRALSAASAAPSTEIPDDQVAAALESEAGNVAGAARRLGIHRNKVRRWLERHGIDAQRFRTRNKRESV